METRTKNHISTSQIIDLVFYGVFALFLILGLGLVFAPQSDNPGIAKEVAKVKETVVHINRVGEWQGSGCILSPDGIVVTARHVSGGSWGEYEVTLDDGRVFGVEKVLEDRNNDIAFFQLDLPEGTSLPFAKLGDESTLRIGDPLFILGSPHGINNFNSVSLGILSGKDRELYDRPGWKHNRHLEWHAMFQSTSPAFPGNSGGPVFNMSCEVIGILVAGEAETLNFSVPVSRFDGVMETIRLMFLVDRFDSIRPAEEMTEEEWYKHTGRL